MCNCMVLACKMIRNDWLNNLDVGYLTYTFSKKIIVLLYDKNQRAPTGNHSLRLNIQLPRGH